MPVLVSLVDLVNVVLCLVVTDRDTTNNCQRESYVRQDVHHSEELVDGMSTVEGVLLSANKIMNIRVQNSGQRITDTVPRKPNVATSKGETPDVSRMVTTIKRVTLGLVSCSEIICVTAPATRTDTTSSASMECRIRSRTHL